MWEKHSKVHSDNCEGQIGTPIHAFHLLILINLSDDLNICLLLGALKMLVTPCVYYSQSKNKKIIARMYNHFKPTYTSRYYLSSEIYISGEVTIKMFTLL